MNINLKIKKLFVAASVVTMGVVVFLVYSLAGLSALPVVFADPPAFVERYAAEMEYSDPSSQRTEPDYRVRKEVLERRFSRLVG